MAACTEIECIYLRRCHGGRENDGLGLGFVGAAVPLYTPVYPRSPGSERGVCRQRLGITCLRTLKLTGLEQVAPGSSARELELALAPGNTCPGGRGCPPGSGGGFGGDTTPTPLPEMQADGSVPSRRFPGSGLCLPLD